MAEGEGFEPPLACAKAVFKTAAFDHSATPPSLSGTGTARGSRTPNLRFWRPLLYQLSYRRPINPESGGRREVSPAPAKRPVITPQWQSHGPSRWFGRLRESRRSGLPPSRPIGATPRRSTRCRLASPSRHRFCRRYPAAHGCCR